MTTLSVMINTDVKMPRKMMDALNLEIECVSCVTGVKTITEAKIRSILTDKYGAKFAAGFKPEFMYKPFL
jgi:hypothetical protein